MGYMMPVEREFVRPDFVALGTAGGRCWQRGSAAIRRSRRGTDLAKRIDRFLIRREQSALPKLIAIGGATEEESCEVQVRGRLDDAPSVRAALDEPLTPVAPCGGARE